jgi:hypothetical protein
VGIPGAPGTGLVVIETGLVLGGLETLLHHPPRARDPRQLGQAGTAGALGECWCFEVGDDLEVMHADRLAGIEATTRGRISARDGVALDAFELAFDLLPTGAALRHLTG